MDLEMFKFFCVFCCPKAGIGFTILEVTLNKVIKLVLFMNICSN